MPLNPLPRPRFIWPGNLQEALLPGDVVIRCSTQPEEHAALVWGREPEDVWGEPKQDTVGIPESSVEAELATGLRPVPKPVTDWQIAGRVHDDPQENEFSVGELVRRAHGHVVRWGKRYTDYANLLAGETWETTCTGLVTAAFRLGHQDVRLLPPDFGPGKEFPCPRTRQPRRLPTPGHLARVFTGEHSLPYEPADAAEAVRWSKAQATLVTIQ